VFASKICATSSSMSLSLLCIQELARSTADERERQRERQRERDRERERERERVYTKNAGALQVASKRMTTSSETRPSSHRRCNDRFETEGNTASSDLAHHPSCITSRPRSRVPSRTFDRDHTPPQHPLTTWNKEHCSQAEKNISSSSLKC
jgi:hypothetical protein